MILLIAFNIMSCVFHENLLVQQLKSQVCHVIKLQLTPPPQIHLPLKVKDAHILTLNHLNHKNVPLKVKM